MITCMEEIRFTSYSELLVGSRGEEWQVHSDWNFRAQRVIDHFRVDNRIHSFKNCFYEFVYNARTPYRRRDKCLCDNPDRCKRNDGNGRHTYIMVINKRVLYGDKVLKQKDGSLTHMKVPYLKVRMEPVLNFLLKECESEIVRINEHLRIRSADVVSIDWCQISRYFKRDWKPEDFKKEYFHFIVREPDSDLFNDKCKICFQLKHGYGITGVLSTEPLVTYYDLRPEVHDGNIVDRPVKCGYYNDELVKVSIWDREHMTMSEVIEYGMLKRAQEIIEESEYKGWDWYVHMHQECGHFHVNATAPKTLIYVRGLEFNMFVSQNAALLISTLKEYALGVVKTKNVFDVPLPIDRAYNIHKSFERS